MSESENRPVRSRAALRQQWVERLERFAPSELSVLDFCRQEGVQLVMRAIVPIIDISTKMIALARGRHPEARLFHADVCRWELPGTYDLIVAWDSTWHVPMGQQGLVLTKLCRGLAAGGVLVFTTGGTDAPSQKRDSCMGPPMYHATLGIPKTLRTLVEAGCVCRHLEYDQYPEDHVYIVAQRAW